MSTVESVSPELPAFLAWLEQRPADNRPLGNLLAEFRAEWPAELPESITTWREADTLIRTRAFGRELRQGWGY